MNKQSSPDFNKRMPFDKDMKQNNDITITDINDLLSKILDLCRDHNGSRLVQKMYSEANDEDKK